MGIENDTLGQTSVLASRRPVFPGGRVEQKGVAGF